MDHQNSTFSKFPALPAELRESIFEQALLPLIEPRLVALERLVGRLRGPPGEDRSAEFRFAVTNRPLLNARDSYVTSATTLSLVCRESHSVVQSFFMRFGFPGPQPEFNDWASNLEDLNLTMGVPLRPEGPHADVFLWHGLSLLDDPKDVKLTGDYHDMGVAKRWLVPMHLLMADFDRWDVLDKGHGYPVRYTALEGQHDIIALVSDPGDGLASLRYSDLTIVSANASRGMSIPGLNAETRDYLLGRFEAEKKSLREFQEARRKRREKYTFKQVTPPERVFPNLYFAYLNSLERSEPPKLLKN